MSERPTPETDAFAVKFKSVCGSKAWVPTDICRRFERERDEAREAAAKWESSFDAMERAGAEQARRADENREWALRAERERDEAREALRTLAEHGENEIQKLIKECDEARNKMADALQEVDLRTLDYERMKQERDEALEALENHTASTTHSCHDQCQRPMCVLRRELDKERERAKELAELVDASYIFVELHKPEGEYNKKWREAWMEKAKRLIPGVDSIWY